VPCAVALLNSGRRAISESRNDSPGCEARKFNRFTSREVAGDWRATKSISWGEVETGLVSEGLAERRNVRSASHRSRRVRPPRGSAANLDQLRVDVALDFMVCNSKRFARRLNDRDVGDENKAIKTGVHADVQPTSAGLLSITFVNGLIQSIRLP
jgi:hypothetical protein